ncbi:MAG TPA: endonuclease/exonuclease/phosphatase, partial [Deltaproteobacteria bacterium]|nr:endonuclease/exonuclease/phosphatase [Deltaproteobacteria bacterium]
YFSGANVHVKKVQRLGNVSDNSEISFAEYPSDHRALLAEFELPEN